MPRIPPFNGAAHILGQPQQLELREVVIAQALSLSVVTAVGGVELSGPHLLIIDHGGQRALLSRLDARAIFLFARQVADLDGGKDQEGSSDGSTAVHE